MRCSIRIAMPSAIRATCWWSCPSTAPSTLRRRSIELQTVGLVPILTHPERNPVILGNPGLLNEYADVGCLFQITANSLTGFWGKPAQKMCEEMLRNKMVHFIASDAHGIEGPASDSLGGARCGGQDRRRRGGRKAGGRQPRRSGRQSGHRADRNAVEYSLKDRTVRYRGEIER